jgi:guanine deaminase
MHAAASLNPVPTVQQDTAETERFALRGDLLDFTGEPGFSDASDPAGAAGAAGARPAPGVRWRPGHWLLVEGGRIVDVRLEPPGPDWPRVDHAGRLVLPGFIDSHVHGSQLDVIGSWGSRLLDWLETHTFPAEQRLADPVHAAQVASTFLDALFAVGTTAACVFPTVHAVSVEAMFEAAQARGMRLITGKVLMDRHAPPALCDDADPDVAERICREQIERWHGQGRLAYAVTPRFAPTSSEGQLAMAGRLARGAPGLYLQTHVAENPDEVNWVRELFPQARSYLDVYLHHGLLNERSVLAHGLWLDDADRAALREHGAHIAHCPSSNLFLGSGLYDWPAARTAGVATSLASDVGGGTSLSMRRTLLDAYKGQAMAGRRVGAWALLHATTRGAAQALRLDGEIGSLEPGHQADLTVWDWASEPVAARRQSVARGLHERVFAWMTLADERDLVETRVAGVVRHARPGARVEGEVGRVTLSDGTSPP